MTREADWHRPSRPAHLLVASRGSVTERELSTERPIVIDLGPEGELRLDEESSGAGIARIDSIGSETVIVPLGTNPRLRVNGAILVAPRPLASGETISVAEHELVYTGPRRCSDVGEILSPDRFERRLRHEVERSLRHGRPLTLVHLDTGGPAGETPDRLGRRLLPAVRPMDIVGFGYSGELLVLLPETGASAEVPAHRLVEALQDTAPGVRAGLARCPDEAADADALRAGARVAAAAAERGGCVGLSAAAEEFEVGGHRVVYADPRMRRVMALVKRLAPSKIPVIVTGETGVGKDIVATALHAWSRRREAPLVTVNCAAIPETLLESELFGHERGAFSGAEGAKTGLFEAASGGTLFLDEVAECSPRAQAELLRVLEGGRIRRVGAVEERPVDVRVVAASNRSLQADIESGRFRRDLFFRLGAAQIAVPRLVDRPLDVPLLLHAFLARSCEALSRPALSLSSTAMQRLLQHDWPGNVRELRNLMELLAATVEHQWITIADLPPQVAARVEPWLAGRPPSTEADRSTAPVAPAGPNFRPLAEEIAELECRRIREALQAAGGVRKDAAELVGMPLRTFANKIKDHGLMAVGREPAAVPERR